LGKMALGEMALGEMALAGGARRPQPRCCCHPLWQREIISARAAAREGSACRTATVALAAPHIGGLMAGPPTPPAPPPPPPPGAPSALRTGAPPAVPNARPPPCSCSCGSSNRASLHEQQRGRRGGDRPRGRAPSTISHARWLCSEADGALQRRWGGAGKKALGRGGGAGSQVARHRGWLLRVLVLEHRHVLSVARARGLRLGDLRRQKTTAEAGRPCTHQLSVPAPSAPARGSALHHLRLDRPARGRYTHHHAASVSVQALTSPASALLRGHGAQSSSVSSSIHSRLVGLDGDVVAHVPPRIARRQVIRRVHPLPVHHKLMTHAHRERERKRGRTRTRTHRQRHRQRPGEQRRVDQAGALSTPFQDHGNSSGRRRRRRRRRRGGSSKQGVGGTL
jgi:hypothetical protein